MKSGERERSLRGKCAQWWQIPFSNRTRLSRSIILGWVRLYRQGGASWKLSTPWTGRTWAAAGLWTRTPPRPWSACAGNCPRRY
ncbi:hypothetical protein DFAR_2480012 [Desulfarculales bacterium]